MIIPNLRSPDRVKLVNAAPINDTLVVQAADYISSCGPAWMATTDIKSNAGQLARVGFNSAVDLFCDKAGGHTVGPQKYLSLATRVWLNSGNPQTSGLNGYVYFEIHNKREMNHIVTSQSCKDYLKKLSVEGSKCYGKDNKDTKGGTWQVGKDDVSYHAIANKIPPTFDAVDKIIVLDGELQPLGNGGLGRTLVPFPTFSFNDITPIRCHSHNDYTRDTALYSALSAGCIGVEVDIWPQGDKLVVGHEDPGTNGPTIQNLYINPIKKLIDERGAVFPAKPGQGLFVLVDFKSNADQTWDLLVKALEPLQSAGYLSTWNGGFKQGLVTVIGSGNAIIDGNVPTPIAKALNVATNPGRSIFVDARVHKDMANFDASNTFYTSASFKDAVQLGTGTISGSNLQKMRNQIKAGHEKGFAVRYWDIPSQSQWQQLVDEGVDRLNVDDLFAVASVNWKL
ncbi:hypothetical protein BU24DRAFT_457653 [Aaosphaeria arxii CBS 175.79]|uniref:Altered inheritance of mitochondria protein 6 n=1 Tax=Aaosphaeria arxii CBS 175.79 TaxID=1450172 RepID=A0A6A5Y8P9_9PLEO|nr:uncharacterized protein BU24DRAFT_457653 [Aaosphaeria arxii CBS 175.79]KAF2021696.1 hypothetical protein BU24DRAFT_457653 [Aaosphaeria arxii CBS 175.79]